jgi:hypothetical protein
MNNSWSLWRYLHKRSAHSHTRSHSEMSRMQQGLRQRNTALGWLPVCTCVCIFVYIPSSFLSPLIFTPNSLPASDKAGRYLHLTARVCYASSVESVPPPRD